MQTGAGKTHTMLGSGGKQGLFMNFVIKVSIDMRRVLSLALHCIPSSQMFDEIQKAKSAVSVSVSVVEVRRNDLSRYIFVAGCPSRRVTLPRVDIR